MRELTKNSSIVVTGVSGFIGSHIVETLLHEGHESVVGIDNLSTGRLENLDPFKDNPHFQFIQQNVSSPEVKELLLGADFIFHQAAIPSVQRSFEQPFDSFEANCGVAISLLETLRLSKNLKMLVCASSSSVYGDTPTLPKVESMGVDPLSPYALQKFFGERLSQIYTRHHNVPTISLRYFNVFGPRQDPNSPYAAVIPRFIKAINSGETVSIYGDGNQTRDFTYVENVVWANINAAKRGQEGKYYNIACGSRISLNDLVKTLEAISGTTVEVMNTDRRPGDVIDSLAAIEEAMTDFEYQVRVDLKEGLTRTWDFFTNS